MLIFDVLAPFDNDVLRFLNVTFSHPWLDQFWLTITQLHKLWWAQVIVAPTFLAVLLIRHKLHGLKVVLMMAIAVLLADGLSYRLIKKNVNRPRPFENPKISSWVRPVGSAHGTSFPSNHAANVFAATGVLGYYFARRRLYFDVFAILVATSRAALGVHYPTDVLAGIAIGLIVSFFVNVVINQRYNIFGLPRRESPGVRPKGDHRRRS